MKNLKVSKKLIISYAFVLILLVVIIAVSIGNLISIRARVEAFYNGPFKVLNAANTVNSSFEAMQKSVFRAISNTDPVIAERALEDSKVYAGKFRSRFPSYRRIFWEIRRLLNVSGRRWMNLRRSANTSWSLHCRIRRRKPLLIWRQTILKPSIRHRQSWMNSSILRTGRRMS